MMTIMKMLCNESYVDSDLNLGNITDCTHALIGSESSGHTGVGYNQNSLTLKSYLSIRLKLANTFLLDEITEDVDENIGSRTSNTGAEQ